jgi:hypothetical protein
LIDRKVPGQPPKLNDAHRAALMKMIEEGPTPAIHGVVRWRLIDLAQWMFEECRLYIAVQTLSREPRKMGCAARIETFRHEGSPHRLDLYFRRHLPKQGTGAALVLPACNTFAMNLLLAEIGKNVAPNAHAALVVDRAGWLVTEKLDIPANITIVPLPAKCPELNPAENVSSCATIGRTASSTHMTISSTIVATHGISSSINHGASCPSGYVIGLTSADQ